MTSGHDLPFEDFIAAAKAHKPGLASRIDRAVDIVCRHLAGGADSQVLQWTVCNGEYAWRVLGSPGRAYVVYTPRDADTTCECEDFIHRGVLCKHILAVRIYRLIQSGRITLPRQFRMTEPAPQPAPVYGWPVRGAWTPVEVIE